MANLNAFSNSASVSTSNVQAPQVVFPPAVEATEGNTWVWGEVPTTDYLIVETTLSGASFAMPGTKTKADGKPNQVLANIWPGKLMWSEGKKGGHRLWASMSAMVMKRDANGVPVVDEDGELCFQKGAQFILNRNGVSKANLAKVAEIKATLANAQALAATAAQLGAAPEMLKGLLEGQLATLEAPSWKSQTVDSRSFVKAVTGGLAPLDLMMNFPLTPKEVASFIKECANLHKAGQPGLLRVFVPMERLALPKEEWTPRQATINGTLQELKHPSTGATIMGATASWGNRAQPIARIELVPNKYLPSSEGMDRVLSLADTQKRLSVMEAKWQEEVAEDLMFWAEELKGKLSPMGVRWAHKAGALPYIQGSEYSSTCDLWQDWSNPAKQEKWVKALEACVGVKPCLKEEMGKASCKGQLFSEAALAAIIASAKAKSIEPWVAHCKGNMAVGVKPTVEFVNAQPKPPAPVVVEEPKVKAVEPEVQVMEMTKEEEDSLPDVDLAAIDINSLFGDSGLNLLDEEDDDLLPGFGIPETF